MYLDFFETLLPMNRHTYTLAATGFRFKSKTFGSRQTALDAMYKEVFKQKTSLISVYDDKHDKTYVCANGIRFYITRD